MTISSQKLFESINISVLTISDTRKEATDKSGAILAKKIKEKGHGLTHKEIVKDDKQAIKKILLDWCSSKEVDVIITTGGTGLTGRDLTPEVLDEIKEKDIPGFGELFRLISYKKIGTSTIQSRATAGILMQTLIFALPGSPNAVKDGWDDILKYQLDSRHKPCNFVEILPRLKES